MNAKEFDQFYTQDDVAVMCMKHMESVIPRIGQGTVNDNFCILEPSAGGGAFVRAAKAVEAFNNVPVFACDIDPHGEGIVYADFLVDDISSRLPLRRRVVTVGNPPFGKKGKLASAFLNKSFQYSKTVGFIMPIQFNKFSGHNQIVPEAKLVLDERLPDNCFIFNGKSYSVRCCFQVWTIDKTDLPDLRIRKSPRTKHPDFEMYQYNCTEEAAKFFDKDKYMWSFAVPRQGFKDFSIRETDPDKLDRRVQWIFFKGKNKSVTERLYKMDFVKLSHKNSTIPGFGKADVVEEYISLYPDSDIEHGAYSQDELNFGTDQDGLVCYLHLRNRR